MREGFYQAYKTKREALDAARGARIVWRQAYGAPVNVVVRYIKHFFSDGRPAWGIYIYRR